MKSLLFNWYREELKSKAVERTWGTKRTSSRQMRPATVQELQFPSAIQHSKSERSRENIASGVQSAHQYRVQRSITNWVSDKLMFAILESPVDLKNDSIYVRRKQMLVYEPKHFPMVLCDVLLTHNCQNNSSLIKPAAKSIIKASVFDQFLLPHPVQCLKVHVNSKCRCKIKFFKCITRSDK